jgi:DNA polymerase-3 subunit delta'
MPCHEAEEEDRMSIWSSLKGHAEQREMFRRTIRRNRLAQAYLFVGPPGIGKQQFATRLSQLLLCHEPDADSLEPCGRCTGCRPFLAGSHPDFLRIGCPPGKREMPIELLAGSSERRGQEGLCHDLSLAPLPGSRKVAIIDDADTMNEASANSFLKTLEEPPDRAVLFLIASNPDALLSTIRSRCQWVRFSPLDQNEVESLLVEQNLVDSAEDARFAASLSEGSLSIAQQLLEPELRALRDLLYSQLAQSNFSGLTLSKQLFEGLGKISSEVPEQRRNSQWLMRFTIEYFGAVIRLLSSESTDQGSASKEAMSLANRLRPLPNSLEILGELIDRTTEASIHIDQNVSIGLALDALYDDLSRTLRSIAASRS